MLKRVYLSRQCSFQPSRYKYHELGAVSSLEDAGKDEEDEAAKKSLLELLQPSQKCKVNQMSGTDLGELPPPSGLFETPSI